MKTMKERKANARNLLTKIDTRMTRAKFALAGAAFGASAGTVHAGGDGGADSASNLIEKILDTIVGVLGWAGVALLVIGVFQTILAFRNGDNNPDAMANGVKSIIVGALLAGFKFIFWGMIKGAMMG